MKCTPAELPVHITSVGERDVKEEGGGIHGSVRPGGGNPRSEVYLHDIVYVLFSITRNAADISDLYITKLLSP